MLRRNRIKRSLSITQESDTGIVTKKLSVWSHSGLENQDSTTLLALEQQVASLEAQLSELHNTWARLRATQERRYSEDLDTLRSIDATRAVLAELYGSIMLEAGIKGLYK